VTDVANDPINGTDPTGYDTVVQLQAYNLDGLAGALGYQHQYVFLRDTDTGETVISRGGPSGPYAGGFTGASSDAPSQNPAGGTVTIVTQMRPAAQSIDSDPSSGKPLGAPVPGSTMTLKGSIDKAEAKLQKFNNAVDAAKIPYTPRSDNSNAYAGSAYRQLTGRTPPSSSSRPGSNNDLTNKTGFCRGTRIGNNGTGSIC
jgi:hypothetical protein